MIKNYIKTAWRNLTRNRMFSVINIGGLAVALAAAWLILLFIGNELSYDRYHDNAERIYRVAQHAEWGGGRFDLALTSAPFAAAFKNNYPEVENAVRVDMEAGGTITFGDKHFREDKVIFADSGFFNVFSYRFLYGNNNALDHPGSMVITRSLAAKIFGEPSAALHKVVFWGADNSNTITGVIEDVPVNAHFTFNGVRRMPETENNRWGQSYLYTYLLLRKGTDVKQLEAKLPSFYERFIKADMERVAGNVLYKLELQPLTSIHLHSALEYEIERNGSMKNVVTFSLIAVLIVLIASVNYMNLSTARSSLRVKEVGIRKVNGSSKAQLASMFLTESVLITFFACLLACLLVNLLKPWFQEIVGAEAGLIQLPLWLSVVICVLFSMIMGVLSGLYPAFFIAGFKLIPSLKGQTGSYAGNVAIRQSLVVFQFAVTITMIAGAIIIYQQLHYLDQKDLGFNKQQVLVYHLNNMESRTRTDLIKDELLKSPLLENAAVAGNPIGKNDIGGQDYRAEKPDGSMGEKDRMAYVLQADEDFIGTLQAAIVAGRNFSKETPTDKDRVVLVNEAFARREGWKDPVGKRIQTGTDSLGSPAVYEVAGVIRDFNIYSLQYNIEPLIVKLPLKAADKDNIYVRLNKNDIGGGLEHIASVFKKFDPVNPFTYNFLDDNFAKQYEVQRRQGKLLMVLGGLAIVIACMGLFGLSTFLAEQRRKEIGIRKVLGSSVSRIVVLLTGNIVKLVIVSMLIAAPVSWMLMSRWLEEFAYRISIHWWVFVVAGLTGLLIAMATIGFKAFSAASANPVKALRTE